MWLSWPSVNSNKPFGVLKQLHWGRVKNISWHASTPSMDWSSVKTKAFLWVIYIPCGFFLLLFFLVILLWGISILYSLLVSSSQGHPSTNCCDWSASRFSLGCEERTCGSTGQGVEWELEGKRWICAKTSHCGRKLSWSVIQWKQMVFH